VSTRERRGWLIVAVLFITLFVVFGGGYNTAGVFFDPMRKYFGWSSARQSSLQTILALTAGVTVPLFGWVLDRIEARIIMSGGVVLAGAALLLASRANSFVTLTAAYIGLGAAIAASTLLPAGLIVANWFKQRRGTALGIVTAGTSIGGMVMTMVAAHTINAGGWRAGYIALALPAFLIAAPLVAIVVRTRPPDEPGETGSANPLAAGLDLGPALRSRSFWMIAAAQFCFSLAGAGGTVHTVPYLIRAGFRLDHAARIFSITFGLASLGKFLMGYGADHLSGRTALALTLGMAALGQILLLGARNNILLGGYVLLYGTMSGAPLALIPMVIAESFGLKRFGSVSGLTGICITLGGAAGPIVGGLIVDRGIGYWAVFVLFAAVLAAGAVAALGCAPLDTGKAAVPTDRPAERFQAG
jgi:predicted MFS family arabinose efflux permease